MGESTVLSLLREFKSGNRKVADFIEETIETLTQAERYINPIVTEVKKFETFYQAEDYHQDFEANNPNHPYIKAISKPRVSRFLQAYPELVKTDLE